MNAEKKFTEYYLSLKEDDKVTIRNMMQKYGVSYPSFYRKLKDYSWNILEKFKLAEITGQDAVILFPELKTTINGYYQN